MKFCSRFFVYIVPHSFYFWNSLDYIASNLKCVVAFPSLICLSGYDKELAVCRNCWKVVRWLAVLKRSVSKGY